MLKSLTFVCIRNAIIAFCNGCFTLIILLIAPLGLAAVITTTLLVIASSFITGIVIDQVLSPIVGRLVRQRVSCASRLKQGIVHRRSSSEIDRYF